MSKIIYIDRQTKKQEVEEIYGKTALEILYGTTWYARVLSFFLLPLFAHVNLLSRLYGRLQHSRLSRSKIKPFIKRFQIDTSEFLEPVESFGCFNDFFIRRLKPSARSFAPGNNVAILPADGRYLVYPDLHAEDRFWIKQHKFSLERLLHSHAFGHKYIRGSMALIRLAPVDYHRFHFPFDCTPMEMKQLDGPLYSVNPMALKKQLGILSRNKRTITLLHTDHFGTVAYIEIGATFVGSIHQTFKMTGACTKGQEKGYFSFGGSCIVLLFEPFRIQFEQDLLQASKRNIEVLGRLGQPLGRSLIS